MSHDPDAGVCRCRKCLDDEELADLRARAARCDAYERAGEALVTTTFAVPGPSTTGYVPTYDASAFVPADSTGFAAGAKQQLARCRARVEAAIVKWAAQDVPDVEADEAFSAEALIDVVREALK